MSLSLTWRGAFACSAVFLLYALPTIGLAQLSPSTVVAKQGGASITLSDIDAFAQGIPESQRAGFFDNPERLQQLITTLLLKRQLAAEARQHGLENDPMAKAEIALATDDALAKARMKQFRADVKIPDMAELAHEEYLGHKSKYIVPGKFDIKQILISTRTMSDAEAKALADKVDKEARAHPDQFDALIEKYSDDPDKATTHGIVHDAGSNRYMPKLVEAAKRLKKPGDITPVVKSGFGYRIAQLVEHTPGHQQTYAEVSDEILTKLRGDYITRQVKNHTDVLHNEPIDANPDLVASLRTRYGQTAAAAKPATGNAD